MWSRNDPLERLLLTVLDRAENREAELLTWGFLDGAFSEAELTAIARDAATEQEQFETPERVLELLRRRRLLFALPGETDRYRTRFAETVRLLARLRQYFRPEEWDSGPRLVTDYRLAIRPRRYPARSVDVE